MGIMPLLAGVSSKLFIKFFAFPGILVDGHISRPGNRQTHIHPVTTVLAKKNNYRLSTICYIQSGHSPAPWKGENSPEAGKKQIHYYSKITAYRLKKETGNVNFNTIIGNIISKLHSHLMINSHYCRLAII
jgi:hypothetical protein